MLFIGIIEGLEKVCISQPQRHPTQQPQNEKKKRKKKKK